MAIRVDRDGFGNDPVAVGVRSSGAQVWDDGTRPAPWIDRPWKDKKEVAASETLQLMSMPADQIRAIRPPVPYVLFPDQELGFVNEPLTIEDVLDTGRWSPQIRSWLSPTIKPPTRADFQAEAWSGTERGGMTSVNPML
jgi:hypothetical protein